MIYAIYGEIHFAASRGRDAIIINRWSEIKIDSSWKNVTDTAEIILPRNVTDFNRQKVSEVFQAGDPVTIKLGYNGELYEEFTGYISQAPAGIPLVIKCEDEMYKLKRRTVNISLKNCTLKQLLQAIGPGYTIQCDETKLMGTMRFPNKTASEVFEELKKQGVNCYFEGKTLHAMDVSTRYSDNTVSVVIEDTAGESLNQKAIEEVLVIIRLLRKIGKKLKVEFGDKNAGTRINRDYSGDSAMTEAQMLSEAKKLYTAAKQPGLDGDVTLFGLPRVKHGYKLNITSVLYPEKKGTYYIDTVSKTANQNGYRQVCKIGIKAT
jgi:hypothetical protein